MSFLKELFRGDPAKSAAKKEKLAKSYQREGKERKAAEEWTAAGRNYARVPDFSRAFESYIQAAQLYLANRDTNREETTLRVAVDVALSGKLFDSASTALNQLTRLGMRLKNDRKLLEVYSLKTLVLIFANELAKARETYREAGKVKKRIRKKGVKFPIYFLTSALVSRFIEGEPIPADVEIPNRIGGSEVIEEMVTQLVELYHATTKSKVSLKLDANEIKIRTPVAGNCSYSSPITLQLLDTRFDLPSNIILVNAPVFTKEPKTRSKCSFVIEATLPGHYTLGPVYALFKVNDQHFYLKSNETELNVIAAKPLLVLLAEPPSNVHSQDEFELLLQIENSSHGDATEVTVTVTLPPEFILRTGTLEKRIITLSAQQNVKFPLYLLATKAGSFEGTINCVYQGASGEKRQASSKFTIAVLPRNRKPKD